MRGVAAEAASGVMEPEDWQIHGHIDKMADELLISPTIFSYSAADLAADLVRDSPSLAHREPIDLIPSVQRWLDRMGTRP